MNIPVVELTSVGKGLFCSEFLMSSKHEDSVINAAFDCCIIIVAVTVSSRVSMSGRKSP